MAYAALQVMSVDSQITRLARAVLGADPQQFLDRDQLEDAAEALAQEYIR